MDWDVVWPDMLRGCDASSHLAQHEDGVVLVSQFRDLFVHVCLDGGMALCCVQAWARKGSAVEMRAVIYGCTEMLNAGQLLSQMG